MVSASYDECWRTVEQHASDGWPARFVHPFDDDHFISGNGTIGLEIVEDLPDVDAVVAPLGGGGLLGGYWRARCTRSGPPRAFTRRSRQPRRRSPNRCARASRGASMRGRRRSSTARAGARCCRRCGRCSAPGCTSRWSCRSTRRRGRCGIVADRTHVIAEGAAACAVAAVLSPEFAQRRHQRVVAVVSGGNIDLARFAELAGACR